MKAAYNSVDSAASADSTGSNCPELDPLDVEWHEQIGQGHASDVFRGILTNAYMQRSGTSSSSKPVQVAIKQLKQTRSLASKDAFAREVAIMSLANHPNIVSLLGMMVASTPWKIVMEFCEGGSLFDLLHHNRDQVQLTWDQNIMMCKQVADAMDYLHRFNPIIIHRDLKSLNLLLAEGVWGPDDVPLMKVADFGLARALEDTMEADNLTRGVGTHNWMAPEMMMGHDYDEKVDVYSFGMVVYEIGCRRVPFENVDCTEMRNLVRTGKRPDASLFQRNGGPPRLLQLMTSCWAQKPAHRPMFTDIAQEACLLTAHFKVSL